MRLHITRSGHLALFFFAAASFLTAADIPKGTKITVRLESALRDTAEFGETFDATLAHDLVVNHKTIALAGSPVEGMVVKASPATEGYAGFLTIQLTSLKTKSMTYVLSTYDVTRQGSGKPNPGEPRPGAEMGPVISGIGKRPGMPTSPSLDQGVSIDTGRGPDVILAPNSIITFQARADAGEVPKP